MAAGLARNSVANGVAGLATTLGGVVSTIIIARMLGVEGTGVVAFAVWVVTFALLAADLGVPGTLTRYVSSACARDGRGDADGIIATLYRPFALSNAAIALAFLGYACWLWWAQPHSDLHITAENYRSSPLFWAMIGMATLMQAFANFTNASLRGFGRFRQLSRLAVASAVVQVGATVVGAWMFGIAGALTGAILGYVIPAVMARSLLVRNAPIDPALKTRIRNYAIEAWFGFIVTAFAWSRMEVFFLERSLGSEAVGLFTAALTLSNIATQGPALLTGALLPFLARHAALNDRERLRQSFGTVMRIFAMAVVPACLGLAAISGQLVPIIFGKDFAPAVAAAAILLAMSAVTVSASISTIYLLALERTRTVLILATCGAVLMVAAGLFIIPHFGPVGAAASRGAIQLFVVIGSVIAVTRYLDIKAPISELVRILISATVMALAAWLISEWVGGVLGVIIAIAIAVPTYAVMLKLFGALTQEDAAELVNASNVLPQRLSHIARSVIKSVAASA